MNIKSVKSTLRDLVLLTREYKGKITPEEECEVHELMTKRKNGISLDRYEARFLQAVYDIKTEFLKLLLVF